MPIEFDCEHCGKKIKAPDEASGRRGKCPFCQNSVYIPAPVSDEDLLDLEPEDPEFEQRRKQRIQELLDAERDLLAEAPDHDAVAVPLDQRENLSSEDLQHLVVNYCLDMSASQLQRAEKHAQQLAKFGPLGRAAVEDFQKGEIDEPALNDIPEPLLEAFLKRLADQISE